MKKLILLFLLVSSAFGTTTVTGHVQTLGTGNVTSGAFVRFWLRGCGGNQPRVAGSGLIAPSQGGVFYFDIPVASNGSVSGTLYSTRDNAGTGNGDIECGGSKTSVWYGMQAFFGGRGGPEMPIVAKSGSTIDVSSITPITTNPVVVAPTGDSTYCRLDGGNGLCGGVSNHQVRWADTFTGSDMGAQANAAISDCSDNCEVHVPAGTYNTVTTTITYPIVTGGNFRLIIDAGAVLNYTGSGCAISAIATSPTNANNIKIYNYGKIIGTSAGKAGICLGASNRTEIWAGHIEGFSNSGSGGIGFGSAIYNEGANTVDIYGAELFTNRIGYYCTDANNVAAGGWFPCNATHFYGGHIQSNTEWGVVINGMPAIFAGQNIELANNNFYGTVIENNASVTPATCSISSWSRTSPTETINCSAPHGLQAGDVVKITSSATGVPNGTTINGTFVVNSTGLTATAFTTTFGAANDTGGAGGTVTQQVGGLFLADAPGTFLSGAYFENNGTQQEVLAGESNCSNSDFSVTGSTFAGTSPANAIQVNCSNAAISKNVLSPYPGYTNFVRLSDYRLTGISVEDNRMTNGTTVTMAAENISALDGTTWDMTWRDQDGSYRLFPKLRPTNNTASQFSPFLKLCGLDGSSTEQCADIASFVNGTLNFQTLSKKPVYFYGIVNLTQQMYTPQIIAGTPGSSGGAITNLTINSVSAPPVVYFTVASTSGIAPVGGSTSGTLAGTCAGNTSFNGVYTLTVDSSTEYYIIKTGSEPTGCGATTAGTVTVGGGSSSGAASQFLSGIQMVSSTGPVWNSGSGAPGTTGADGTHCATGIPIGSLYTRTDAHGAGSTYLYVCEGSAGNGVWTAK